MKGKLLPSYCISGRPMESIEGVILHYFSAINVDPDNAYDLNACRDLFKDLNRPREERTRYMTGTEWPARRQYASAHYLIGRCGTIWQLVGNDKQAYHAGFSMMDGSPECNKWTLGVELVGGRETGFTREQYTELSKLLIDLESRYPIHRDAVCGHDSVRYEAILNMTSTRPVAYKYDPSGARDGKGDNFDWLYLGKMMNDIKPNPEGVAGLEILDHLD